MAPPGMSPPDHFLMPSHLAGAGAGSDHLLVLTSSYLPISWRDTGLSVSSHVTSVNTHGGGEEEEGRGV